MLFLLGRRACVLCGWKVAENVGSGWRESQGQEERGQEEVQEQSLIKQQTLSKLSLWVDAHSFIL